MRCCLGKCCNMYIYIELWCVFSEMGYVVVFIVGVVVMFVVLVG